MKNGSSFGSGWWECLLLLLLLLHNVDLDLDLDLTLQEFATSRASVRIYQLELEHFTPPAI